MHIFLQGVEVSRLQDDHQDGEAEEQSQEEDEALLVAQHQGRKHCQKSSQA